MNEQERNRMKTKENKWFNAPHMAYAGTLELTGLEQRRYEVARAVLAAIKTNPSKYGNSPESMRDAARHAIKQADAFLDMLGREKQAKDPVEIVECYKAKLESHRDNTELSQSTEEYQYGIRILDLIIHEIKRNQEEK